MLKKVFILFLLFSFNSSTFSVQAMSYTTNPYTEYVSNPVRNKIVTFKQLFFYFNSMNVYKQSPTKFSKEETETIKKFILISLNMCLEELNSPEYFHQVELLADKENIQIPDSIKSIINGIFQIIKSSPINEDRAPAIISTLTIIGSPIGLVLTFLSWIPYAIALYFQDIYPLIGLFFYAISVLMTGIGWYFIL
jgi:hypothetical protein